MYFKSKKTTLIILGLTSLFFTRAMFWFVNDPEGPNLLVVAVLGGAVFAVSWFIYSLKLFSSTPLVKRLLLTILIQVVIIIGLYFILTELPKLPFEQL